MSNIWFTADFHLGHANIIRYCARPFAVVDRMDTPFKLYVWRRPVPPAQDFRGTIHNRLWIKKFCTGL